MNPTFNFLLSLTTVLATTTVNAFVPVFDVDGDPITSSGSYYVLPAHFAQGGLSLLGRDGKQCPLDIVQLKSEVDKGFPVKFFIWWSRNGIIPESVNLNIETVASTICVQPTYWWLDEKNMVTTGPKPEGFSGESSKSFFQINKSSKYGRFAYKFASCPDSCIDVGITVDGNNVRRLALNHFNPLDVVFIKSAGRSSKIMSII